MGQRRSHREKIFKTSDAAKKVPRGKFIARNAY